MTRKEYLSSSSPTAHREYYAQYVTDAIVSHVGTAIGQKLLRSTDEHFNDIPLRRWDDIGWGMRPDFKAYGDSDSLAGRVCIVKEAARQWLEQERSHDA